MVSGLSNFSMQQPGHASPAIPGFSSIPSYNACISHGTYQATARSQQKFWKLQEVETFLEPERMRTGRD